MPQPWRITHVELTDAIISAALAAAEPGVQVELRDASGLLLRARRKASGDVSGHWAIRRMHEGRQRRLTLGAWPGMKIGAARAVLSVALGRLAKDEDIFAAAEAAEAAAAAAAEAEKRLNEAPTVAEAITGYRASRLATLRSADEIERALKLFLKPLADRKIVTVEEAEVQKLADAIVAKSPSAARLGIAYSRGLWAWAAGRGEVPAPLTLKSGKAKERKRRPSLEEMRAIWAFAEADSYPYGPIVQTLMLTALRRGEVAGLRVREVDFKARLLRLPAERMKTDEPFEVALSEPAMAVLQRALASRPRDADGKPSPFVFATVPDAPFSGWSKAKRRADKAVGFSDWTLHDFRRGIVTAMAHRGLSDVGTLDAMLGHAATASVGSGAAAVYQQSALLASRRKAAAIWADLLLGDAEAETGEGEAEGAEAA